MVTQRRIAPRRLGEGTRRKLEVTSAMAWESLVETHVEQAAQFIQLIQEHEPLQEALPRYLRELDLGDTMAAAIRTRVLMRLEDESAAATDPSADQQNDPIRFPAAEDGDGDAADSWALLRRPHRVVQDVIRRQRRSEAADFIAQLSLARAEENVIKTHVENAISFVALLQDQLPIDRSVQQYLTAVGLAGSRAQTVFQRTMAKLADVHLPI